MQGENVQGPLKRLVAIVGMLFQGGFLDTFRTLQAWFPGVSIQELLGLVGRIVNLVRELPGGSDEDACRLWVKQVMLAGDRIATWTKTEADDTVVEWMDKAIANDSIWSMAIYPAMAWILDGKPEAEMPMMAAADEAEKVGIDPATIVLIVTTIVELVKLFRSLRGK